MKMILEGLIAEYGIDAVLDYLLGEEYETDAEFEIFLEDELGISG